LAIIPVITRNFRGPAMAQNNLAERSPMTDDPSSIAAVATGIGADGENPRPPDG
jgi:hypothetical protein